MVIIISESQLPRLVGMNWLYRFTKDFRKVEYKNSIKVVSNNDEVIFDYDTFSNELKIDYSTIWTYLYHHLRFSKEDSKLIIREFAIDFLGFKELKIGGVFKIEKLNDFEKQFKLNEQDEEKLDISKIFSKFIKEIILPNFPWAKRVYKCELTQREDNTTDAYILIELNPKYVKDFKKPHGGFYSEKDGGRLLYGNEVANVSEGIDPFRVANEIFDLAKNMGLNPDYSLFSTFFILKD